MLNKLPISIIKYLCFGCDKCKDTEDELFVYSYLYDKVYLGTKRGKVYFFYKDELETSNYLHNSLFSGIEVVSIHPDTSPRITSLKELMERIKGCG